MRFFHYSAYGKIFHCSTAVKLVPLNLLMLNAACYLYGRIKHIEVEIAITQFCPESFCKDFSFRTAAEAGVVAGGGLSSIHLAWYSGLYSSFQRRWLHSQFSGSRRMVFSRKVTYIFVSWPSSIKRGVSVAINKSA